MIYGSPLKRTQFLFLELTLAANITWTLGVIFVNRSLTTQILYERDYSDSGSVP